MPNPQDVAVPSLPEREIVLPCRPASAFFHRFKDGKCAALERLQQAQERREDGWQGHWRPVYVGDALDAYARAAVIADRAAGRASAEPEGEAEPVADARRFVYDEHVRPLRAGDDESFPGLSWYDFGSSRMHPCVINARGRTVLRDGDWIVLIGTQYHAFTPEVYALLAAPTPTASIAPKADPLSASVESNLAERASKPFEFEGNRSAAPKAEGEAAIDMVLHCPKCGRQHIDAPDGEPHLNVARIDEDASITEPWDNPPHRSHLCHGCGHIWRPADVPTNGVAAVKTTGKADSPIAAPVAQAAAGAWQPQMRELITKLRSGDWSLRSPDELACMVADMLERAIPRIAAAGDDADRASGGGV